MTRRRTVSLTCMSLIALLGSGLSTVSAQLGQRSAQEYIDSMERPERVADLKIDEIIGALELKPGDIVADIGSASGIFSIPMARAIGPTGTLYAVDIDKDMLDYVVNRAKKEGVANVRTALGEYNDPKLPVRNVDVAFFHSVLHMIEHRQAYLNAVAKYLKPDGRIVVIDRNPEHVTGWMWLKQSDVDSWMAAISFYPAQQFHLFDTKYFVVYQRPYGNSILLKRRSR